MKYIHGREVMRAGTWGSWSHGMQSEEAEQDERSCGCSFLLSLQSKAQAQEVLPLLPEWALLLK